MDLNPTKGDLDLVFGAESSGKTLWERASSSKIRFVRSQDHLAVWTPEATGRVLTAWEASDVFGFKALAEAVVDGVAAIPPTTDEPAASLRQQRLDLGLSVRYLARAAGLDSRQVELAENPRERTPIRVLEKLAIPLGLDERQIGFRSGAGADAALAVRLRTLGNERATFSENFVLALDEAAWVIATESRLRSWLGFARSTVRDRFEPSSNYGDERYPAWSHGQYLARETRKILGISMNAPIENLKDLVEQDLGVPVVQLELTPSVAGATVAISNTRGIAVNLRGSNANVWVRRMTVAHELGHLLWDPADRLTSLRVDDYRTLEDSARFLSDKDYVEQRANAFAAELLAPQAAVLAVINSHPNNLAEGLASVMETFGVSHTVARFQSWNAMERSTNLERMRALSTSPSDDWIARETYAVDFFPINATPLSRRGAFAGLVAVAEYRNLITDDTAASYLNSTRPEFAEESGFIRDMFPFWSTH